MLPACAASRAARNQAGVHLGHVLPIHYVSVHRPDVDLGDQRALPGKFEAHPVGQRPLRGLGCAVGVDAVILILGVI